MEYKIALKSLNSREVYETLRRDQERDAFPQARDVGGLGGFEDNEHEDDGVVDRLHELERCTPDVAPERKEIRRSAPASSGTVKDRISGRASVVCTHKLSEARSVHTVATGQLFLARKRMLCTYE